MFVFLIPRTPKKYRSPLRNELWELCKQSLLCQTSKNWKAIVIGDTKFEDLDPQHFIRLDFDDYGKLIKLKEALALIESWENKPEYLIRLDDDDLISRVFLEHIEGLDKKFDCYYDENHTCIDLVYLKISQVKNLWLPNTVIHKYNCAIEKCGNKDVHLILQDHDEFWHIYYANREVYKSKKVNPVYNRILTPFSITSSGEKNDSGINWQKHLSYLNGYGPWVNLSENFFYMRNLREISRLYFSDRPSRPLSYWIYNKIKYTKNLFFQN